MPYFSISSKYPAPNGLDPSLQRFLNGLPLGTIRARVFSVVQSIASGAGYKTIQFRGKLEDTASFVPTGISAATPIPGLVIPPQAGGLYMYSLYGIWNAGGAAAPPAFANMQVSFDLGSLYTPETQFFSLGELRIVGFQYLNPGDGIYGGITQSSGGAVSFGGAVLKIARITV